MQMPLGDKVGNKGRKIIAQTNQNENTQINPAYQ